MDRGIGSVLWIMGEPLYFTNALAGLRKEIFLDAISWIEDPDSKMNVIGKNVNNRLVRAFWVVKSFTFTFLSRTPAILCST